MVLVAPGDAARLVERLQRGHLLVEFLDHLDREALLARGLHRLGQILANPLGLHVPLRPHRQVDAAEARLRHQLGHRVIAQPLQGLREYVQAVAFDRGLRTYRAQRRCGRDRRSSCLKKASSCHGFAFRFLEGIDGIEKFD